MEQVGKTALSSDAGTDECVYTTTTTPPDPHRGAYPQMSPRTQADSAEQGPGPDPEGSAEPEARFTRQVAHCIEAGDLSAARTHVAEAEIEGDLPRWHICAAKARIALAGGDLEAATAILVMAIEAAPQAPALRRLMTEVLLARGSAGHARDVLAHLGQPPTEYDIDGKPVPRGTRDRA